MIGATEDILSQGLARWSRKRLSTTSLLTVGISTCPRIAWAQCDEYTCVNHIQIITTFKYATFLIMLVHVLQTGLNPQLNKPLQINPNITQLNNDKFCAAFRSGSCLLKFILGFRLANLDRILNQVLRIASRTYATKHAKTLQRNLHETLHKTAHKSFTKLSQKFSH